MPSFEFEMKIDSGHYVFVERKVEVKLKVELEASRCTVKMELNS